MAGPLFNSTMNSSPAVFNSAIDRPVGTASGGGTLAKTLGLVLPISIRNIATIYFLINSTYITARNLTSAYVL